MIPILAPAEIKNVENKISLDPKGKNLQKKAVRQNKFSMSKIC